MDRCGQTSPYLTHGDTPHVPHHSPRALPHNVPLPHPGSGTCIAHHNIRFFYGMLFWFATAGMLIPIALITYCIEALEHLRDYDLGLIVLLMTVALYFLCTCGALWMAAVNFFADVTARLGKNPNATKAQQQADQYEESLYRSNPNATAGICSPCCLPVRFRQH
mmetsp:Transcript_18615/g.50020  ORF Transcript_18615/g.50020 Transcript_18615/m.50020 type:complete len:164 (-) Transcript_18615:441-932(-)